MPSEGLARNGLHLAALTSFAFAQQYFEPLADGPDFFIERGATSLDVILFALGFVVVPPVVLLATEAVASLAGRRVRDAVHLAFVGGLAGLIAWQAITGADPGVQPLLAYAIATLLGGAATLAYARAEPVRWFLSILGVAPVVVLVLFLGFSPVRVLAFGGGGPEPERVKSNGTPVVLMVLDELPTASLLDARGEIDSGRLPGFTALARDSTWYRNAASPADYTQLAVPTILTGNRPRADRLQIASEHPRNLFTLLGAGHRLDAFEALTDICRTPCERQVREPFGRRMRGMVSSIIERVPALPAGLRGRVARALSPDGPPEAASRSERYPEQNVRRFVATTQDVRFERFLDTLGSGREPTVNFLHLVLPHRPWRYLPDGRRYSSPRAEREVRFGRWPSDRRVVDLAWQRHLLQTSATDRLVARLMAKLRATGTYEHSLVAVVADHGAAFRPGDQARVVTSSNVGEIAPVPMFVKAPGQRRGRVNDSAVETTDLFPTIAAQLRARLPWRVDGVSAQTRPKRGSLTVTRQAQAGEVEISRRRLVELRDQAVRQRLRVFRNGLYELGPRLAGRPTKSVRRVAGARALLDSGATGLAVEGRVEGVAPRSRPVAVSVNGVVRATGWTLVSEGREYFTVLVPPASVRPGRDKIEVLFPSQ